MAVITGDFVVALVVTGDLVVPLVFDATCVGVASAETRS